jgi:uncharacterized protein YbjT (DUF2867 family)
MMLAIFGASGKTGHQLVEQALAAGHEVRALTRDPAKLRIAHERLEVVAGNVLDPAAVSRTVQGAAVVISALGIGAGNPEGAITAGVRNIAAAMREAGVRRLIAMSSLGIGDSKGQIPLAFKLAIMAIPVLRHTMADLATMEEFLHGTGLDWIIVRPGGLQDRPARGNWHVSSPDEKLTAGDIPRADVAAFILQQLTSDTYLRQTPGVT